MSDAHQAERWMDEGCSVSGLAMKKEEVEEEDFTFDELSLKKQKTGGGQPTALPSPQARALRDDLNMTWDLIEVCVCVCLSNESRML